MSAVSAGYFGGGGDNDMVQYSVIDWCRHRYKEESTYTGQSYRGAIDGKHPPFNAVLFSVKVDLIDEYIGNKYFGEL